MTILISAIKIIFLLGFLITIHEAGHLLIAKACKVKVNEFSIGFGPAIWNKQGKETKYSIRIIPLGGYCSMEGEEERKNTEGSFSEASIPKRIAIVAAGAIVNILFGILVYFIMFGPTATGEIIVAIFKSLKQLFTAKVGVDQMMGPVGISQIVATTSGFKEFMYVLALISISLGVTNLLPIPALDGGKILLLVIEAIRKKPLSERTEINIQLIGFSILIALSLYITYNDILRIF